MRNNYLESSFLALLVFGSSVMAQEKAPLAVTLSSSPTLSFSSAIGFGDNVAQDGEGGSVEISDADILVYPINSSAVKLTAVPLQYHDGNDPGWPGYPAIITYGDAPAHYGWVIKSSDGSNFSLEALSFLDWGNFNGDLFAVEAIDNNSSKGAILFKGNETADLVQLTNTGLLTSIFNSVDEVRVYQQRAADTYIALNNIKVGSAVVTDINDDNFVKSLNLFPNPTEGIFTLELLSEAQVTISNTLGKVVFDKTLTSGTQTINLKTETNGIYVLKAKTGHNTVMMKFAKE